MTLVGISKQGIGFEAQSGIGILENRSDFLRFGIEEEVEEIGVGGAAPGVPDHLQGFQNLLPGCRRIGGEVIQAQAVIFIKCLSEEIIAGIQQVGSQEIAVTAVIGVTVPAHGTGGLCRVQDVLGFGVTCIAAILGKSIVIQSDEQVAVVIDDAHQVIKLQFIVDEVGSLGVTEGPEGIRYDDGGGLLNGIVDGALGGNDDFGLEAEIVGTLIDDDLHLAVDAFLLQEFVIRPLMLTYIGLQSRFQLGQVVESHIRDLLFVQLNIAVQLLCSRR